MRYFDEMERSRRMLDLVSGRSSFIRALEQNRSFLDGVTGQNSVLKTFEQNRTFLDAISGQTFAFKVLDDNQKLLDMVSRWSSILDALNISRKLLDGIVTRPAFADMIGAQRTVSEIISRPHVASMIGVSGVPRAAWLDVFSGLREGIGSDLYDEAIAEFETAAEIAGDPADEPTWWVERLPLSVQLGLLVLALQALDKAGKFMVDLSGGEDLPPAFRSGTETLFALVIVLLAVIEARFKAASDDDENDR